MKGSGSRLELTEKVLILKTGRFKETDMWVRFISPGMGVESAFAFGGAKSRKRFMGCLDGLSLVLFKMNKSGHGYTLAEGTLLNSFRNIKKNSSLLGPAVNCLKFLESFEVGPDWSRQAFDLALSVLDCLDQGLDQPEGIPLLFKTKVTFEQGYGPNLKACGKCGRGLGEFSAYGGVFSVEQGCFLCPDCARGKSGIALSTGAARTLDWIRHSNPCQWAGFQMHPGIKGQCYEFVDRFLGYHPGLKWENGKYRRI